jgi:xylan 1,4-beta-xylosidase
MKNIHLIAVAIVAAAISCSPKVKQDAPVEFTTIANPLNLSYRFCLDSPSRREAADPSIVFIKDRYFLFASKSGGYWHSPDLIQWTFLPTNEIPVEEYAPSVVVVGDTCYFLASSMEKSTLYKSSDPLSGKWSVACEALEVPVWDPAFHYENDKLYLYWGCSNKNPIYGVELDYKNNFRFIGKPVELIHQNPAQHGWEVPGDYNRRIETSPWIEGAWVNKVNGKYYLQYAGPGTEFKAYSDAVYVGASPLGPFTLAAHNPFAYKPEGFMAGAGHGSTFEDKYGNLWHIGTITISQKHMFERRLALYPTFIDNDGALYSSTRFGDYPMIIPQKKISTADEVFPGWMLLSYKRNVSASSSVDTLSPANVTDEEIRTYWAAKTGDATEWLSVDLGAEADVFAIQVNFAEHGTSVFGRQPDLAFKYQVEYSINNSDWSMLADKAANMSDNSHDYTQLPAKVSARYIRIKNIRVPSGHFAVSDLRIFGLGYGEKPAAAGKVTLNRNPEDKRQVIVSWKNVPGATGYNIRYGTHPEKLYSTYQVMGDTSVVINSLSTLQEYHFAIEPFNENGYATPGTVSSTAGKLP